MNNIKKTCKAPIRAEKKKKEDTLELIGTLISLLNSKMFDSTIKNIAEYCQIPLPLTRKILLTFKKNLILRDYIFSDDDIDDLESEEFEDNLLNGSYDDKIFDIVLPYSEEADSVLLTFMQAEYPLIRRFVNTPTDSLYEIKSIIPLLKGETHERRQEILYAIESDLDISFFYKVPGSTAKRIQCHPIGISANVTDNWIYLYTSTDAVYRIDRILSTCKRCNPAKKPLRRTSTPHQNLKSRYIWGTSSDYKSSPVHVKVLIKDATENILAKIRNDTRYRKETGRLYCENNSFYYEDDIIGIDDFRRWLRGYGSSLIVLEPENLRQKILESTNKTLALYEEAEKWRDL